MANKPIMATATAVWLVDNSILTFRQIADFCGLHELEVQGIADGEVAAGVRGHDPVTNNQLDADELKRGEADPGYALKLKEVPDEFSSKQKKGPRYTPVSKRQDKPAAIAWLLKNHAELSEAQIISLVGTTKNTIQAVRERTHWNINNIQPTDPVALGLCRQLDLDEAVRIAVERSRKEAMDSDQPKGQVLAPMEETLKSRKSNSWQNLSNLGLKLDGET